MNQHLSQQQIDEWLIGLRPADVEDHLQSCPTCADEVARVDEPLALFGGVVRDWSEQQMGPVRATWRTTPAPARGWRFGLAVAALWLLVLVPLYRHHVATQLATQQAALAAAQDEVLLRQVQRELTRSVPAPMEPLAKLMPNDLTR